MNRITTLIRCGAGAACSALLLASTALGQYVETNRGCISCHESPQSKSDFCDAVPATVWRQDDKHRRAFELLHESNSPDAAARAQKQALVRQILGFDLREAFIDDRYSRLIEPTTDEAKNRLATVKACLRCHGTWPKEADKQLASAPPVPLELGVSCQACHGPGERWLAAHFSESWRRVSPEAKAALGCADCRSPIAKAKLCASCHVGNIAEEKFVRHEWYAAGHPPLPSFELASFEDQMPRHWKSLREKGPFKYRDAPSTGEELLPIDQRLALERAGIPAAAIRSSYVEANFHDAVSLGSDPANDLSAFKDVVLGGVTVYSVYAELLAEYSDQVLKGAASWPELALYDCTACHHELRSGLGTKTRPNRSHVPGRPPLATWPLALTRLAEAQRSEYSAEHFARQWKPIDEQLMRLDRAAAETPFGHPQAISVAANELLSLLQDLTANAAVTHFDQKAAGQAIGFLTEPRNFDPADFYTARQVAWAISAISNDLNPGSGPLLFSQNADDPLALRLPSGPNQSVMENLRRWLPAAGRYDSSRFQEELRKIPQLNR